MKKLLMVSDSFKGTLSSKEIISIAKHIIDKYFKDSWTLDSIPLADGGEGSLGALSSILKGRMIDVKSLDAEGHKIKAPIFVSGETVYIEVASALGLPLIKNDVDPLLRSSRGVGILIKEALKLGVKKITVGLGGSSTNDLGLGMLNELGVRFIGVETPSMSNCNFIKGIDTSSFLNLNGTEIICLSDVNNPVLGKNGATYVFGPQKGYSYCLDELENKMNHLVRVYEEASKKKLDEVPKLGAAGGLGAAFYAFLNAKMESGIEEILRVSSFKEKVENADLVITGEGCFDSQSLEGKVFTGVSKYVSKDKLIVIAGSSSLVNPPVPVYVTSISGESLDSIKLHAKEDYAKTLKIVLDKYKD